MIEKIKELIRFHKKSFPNGTDTTHLYVSKFFHGKPAWSKKILFLVSTQNGPLCIVKVARDEKYNDCISREIAGLSYAGNTVSVPKLFFHGKAGDIAYMCEEIISGSPVGKSREHELFSFVVKMHSSSTRGKRLRIHDVMQLFQGLPLAGHGEFDSLWAELTKRKNDCVYLSPQHGDMTYKNIMLGVDETPILIDWENFGLRNIWGIDLVHYLIRIVHQGDISHEANMAVAYFKKETHEYLAGIDLDISPRDLENLFLLDWIFDVFQKNYPLLYNEIIPRMEKIWSL